MSRFSLILWAILLIGIGVKRYYHLPPEKTAAVYRCAPDSLGINHQLVAVDLQANDDQEDADAYVGKYLVTAKKKGNIIVREDLASNPFVPRVSKDSAMVILLLRDDETLGLQTLDAGSHIYLIPASISDSLPNKNIAGFTNPAAVKVLAVHRATPKTPGNWLWLEFPVTLNQKVAAFIAAQKRIIIQAGE